MSLGCAAGSCGDCCEDIFVGAPASDVIAEWREYLDAGGLVPLQEAHPDADPSIEFIARNWTETSRGENGATYECSRFDRVHRVCTAWADRPAVCSGFPWYEGHPDDGGGPTPQRISKIPLRCSFALDVPVAQRREGARPLIPLAVVRR